MATPLGKHTNDASSIDLGTQVERDLNLQGKGEGRVPSGPLGWLNQSLLPLIIWMFVESRGGDAREKSFRQGVPQRATIPAGLTHISKPVADKYVACRRKRPHTSLLMRT